MSVSALFERVRLPAEGGGTSALKSSATTGATDVLAAAPLSGFGAELTCGPPSCIVRLTVQVPSTVTPISTTDNVRFTFTSPGNVLRVQAVPPDDATASLAALEKDLSSPVVTLTSPDIATSVSGGVATLVVDILVRTTVHDIGNSVVVLTLAGVDVQTGGTGSAWTSVAPLGGPHTVDVRTDTVLLVQAQTTITPGAPLALGSYAQTVWTFVTAPGTHATNADALHVGFGTTTPTLTPAPIQSVIQDGADVLSTFGGTDIVSVYTTNTRSTVQGVGVEVTRIITATVYRSLFEGTGPVTVHRTPLTAGNTPVNPTSAGGQRLLRPTSLPSSVTLLNSGGASIDGDVRLRFVASTEPELRANGDREVGGAGVLTVRLRLASSTASALSIGPTSTPLLRVSAETPGAVRFAGASAAEGGAAAVLAAPESLGSDTILSLRVLYGRSASTQGQVRLRLETAASLPLALVRPFGATMNVTTVLVAGATVTLPSLLPHPGPTLTVRDIVQNGVHTMLAAALAPSAMPSTLSFLRAVIAEGERKGVLSLTRHERAALSRARRIAP